METMVSRTGAPVPNGNYGIQKVFFLLYQGNIFGKCQNERSGSYHLFQSLSVGSLHETDHSKIFALFVIHYQDEKCIYIHVLPLPIYKRIDLPRFCTRHHLHLWRQLFQEFK